MMIQRKSAVRWELGRDTFAIRLYAEKNKLKMKKTRERKELFMPPSPASLSRAIVWGKEHEQKKEIDDVMLKK